MRIFSYELDLAPNSIWETITSTAAAKAQFIFLQEVGYFFAEKKYYTLREGLDSFLIKLTVSGQGVLEYGGHTEQIGPGYFYWIDCMNHQNYYTDPSVEKWDVIWIHFSGGVARAYYDAFRRLNGGSVVGKTSNDSQLFNLLNRLATRYTTKDNPHLSEQNLFEFDVITSGILTQILIDCISSVGTSGRAQHIPPLVADIRNYITARYNEKITLEHLAAEFNLDPFYLQKLFKRTNGQSPMEYIIYLRMTKAKSLLRTTGMSVGEIAYTVGIENISHFTRQFKKLEGMTPGQYRMFWPTG